MEQALQRQERTEEVSPAYLKLAGIRKDFGSFTALRDIDLQVAKGEFVCFLGPSGCGKTTLLRIIAGLEAQSAGCIELAGRDISALPPAERNYGIVFQSYALFPNLSVADNVAYGLVNRKMPKARAAARVSELLKLVGLPGNEAKYPAQLSGGQQQRIALARALATAPSLLLLDEPLSALDAATRVVMRDEVRRIQKMHNIAALLITHDQDEALSLADRIAVLKDGRLVQYDTPAAIYDRPADGFVAAFVGRANVLAGTVSGPEQVDCPFGRLQTLPHGLRDGAAIKVLIRPERLEPAAAGESGINVFEVRVLKDRFFGATRQLDMTIGEAVLKLETTSRAALTRVRVPVEAIQFLPNP
jgi:iron(III) transport system ATP-binding protein